VDNKLNKKVLVILALLALISTVGIVTAQEEDDPIRFEGYIKYSDGTGVAGVHVEIKKCSQSGGVCTWKSMGNATTDNNGLYKLPSAGDPMTVYRKGNYYRIIFHKADTYKMFINGQEVDERYIPHSDWTREGICIWSYQWCHRIPINEFTTVAIPSVIAILGLFAWRRNRQE